MSLAAVPTPGSAAAEFFAKTPRWFWRLGQAGQHFFLELWFKLGFEKGKIRITDWQIAQMCGRGLRWAQKAIRQLLDFLLDGEAHPLIARYRAYGRRNESGRVIEIIVDFVPPAEKPAAAPVPKPARKAAPAQIPNVPPIPPTTPEHLAAAARANAAVDEEPEPEETPEQKQAAIDRFREQLGLKKRQKRPSLSAAAPAPATSAPAVSRQHTPEELRGQLDAIKRMREAEKAQAQAQAPAPPAPDDS
jgi:hypothetical protein